MRNCQATKIEKKRAADVQPDVVEMVRQRVVLDLSPSSCLVALRTTTADRLSKLATVKKRKRPSIAERTLSAKPAV
jgi:hypothetical protein